jgi:nitrate reductase NapE component
MARQRIVINVDGPPSQTTVRRARAGGGKPRRWLRVLAILAVLILVVVVVAAVGGFLWWRSYQTTPAYTLALLIDAAQRNDAAEFEKRINDDEIAKNMVASVSQKAAGRYGLAINSSVQSQIDKLVPSMLPSLKQTIHDEVVKQIKEFAAKSQPQPFILLVVGVPRLVTVTTQGDTANVKAPLNDRTIELTMQRDADRWRVTEFKDDVVVQRIVDNVMKDLPAIGSIDSNSPLFKKPQRRRRPR